MPAAQTPLNPAAENPFEEAAESPFEKELHLEFTLSSVVVTPLWPSSGFN